MSHPKRSVRSRLLLGVLATAVAAALAGAGAAPASAAPSRHHVLTYAALGDSYAAGQSSDCTHTATSYPLLLDRLRSIRLVQDLTCAGATSEVVRLGQVPALRSGVKLVTVTVGGNDLDVAGLAAVCAPDPSSVACQTGIATRQQALPALYVSLQATIAAIGTAAPRARILVTGYPSLVSTGPIAVATQALDSTIRSATLSASTCQNRVRYVDVQFTGHTLDSADPWFNSTGPDAFHPTAAGQRAYARAIAAALHHHR